MKTVAEMAKKVADYFNKCVVEGEYDNFKEMRQNYDWTAQDIRDEIMCCLRDFCNEDFAVNGYSSEVDYYDDGTVTGKDGEFTYGQFKKLVFVDVN